MEDCHMPRVLYDIITSSAADTEAAGADLARRASAASPVFIALFGELGAGKTAFTRGFMSIAAPDAHVASPTYSIVNSYAEGIFHYDMYRVTGEDDLISIGYYDMFRAPHVALVEWSENIIPYLPKEYIKVEIAKISEHERRILITEVGE
jgi:tRNA threonylcarbamoyladenosine biosynthesis protein TsaE